MNEALLEQVINGLMMGSIYVLVALGMVLIYGVMHVVNFAHGVLFTMGGYLGHFFYHRLVDSYVLAILLSMLTLGLILFLENGVVALWGANALQWKVATTERFVEIGELRFSQHHLGIILITLVLVAALGLYLKYTRFGTAIRATSQSQEAAIVVGIPVRRVQWTTFAIGAMLAGIGGALVGPLFLVFPQMGDVPLIKGLAGILLGGMGSVPGAVIGGLLLGVTESVSTLYLPTDYRDSIAFMVMVLILLVRPQGLFGQRMRGED
jgi:branched-chain amino acid transport system permease protein